MCVISSQNRKKRQEGQGLYSAFLTNSLKDLKLMTKFSKFVSLSLKGETYHLPVTEII